MNMVWPPAGRIYTLTASSNLPGKTVPYASSDMFLNMGMVAYVLGSH